MSKKVKVLVRDKNTLVLDEAAGIGDIIDLTELKEFDSTALEAAIDAGKERVYEQKLNELKQVFNLEKNQEVNKLKGRDKEIIEYRYGLNGKKELTQKEVATLMGISQSYISRIEKKVIKKLKNIIVI